MTKNQIEYNKLLEDQRYHRTQTDIAKQQAINDFIIKTVGNQLTKRSIDESARHNLEQERISNISMNEIIRHNIATEYMNRLTQDRNYSIELSKIELGNRQAAETERANQTRERYNTQQLKTSTQLSYKQLEESRRSNLANESIKKAANKESKRANQAREKETHRTNIAQEKETKRSNVARERETLRSNKANESYRDRALKETQRSNKAQENLGFQRNVETSRANRANEALQAQNLRQTQQYNYDYLNQQKNANLNSYTLGMNQYNETVRHNKVVESTNQQQANTSVARAVADNVTKLIPLVTRRKVKVSK